jgi:cell division control protein 11
MSKSRKEPASNLNIIVIGATGCGKTMFTRTLCERVKGYQVQGSFRESSPRVLQGPLKPTQELYSVSMQLEQSANQRATSFTIIDTQGLVKGVALGHQLGFLAKYIDHQLERSLIEVI